MQIWHLDKNKKESYLENIPECGNSFDAEIVTVAWTKVKTLKFPHLKAIINRSMGKEHLSHLTNKIFIKDIGDFCSEEIADYVIKRVPTEGMLGIAGEGRIGKKLHEKRKENSVFLHHNDITNLTKLRTIEYLSIHFPLTDKSYHWFDMEKMKMCRNLVLINTSRGKIVNTRDLLVALERKHISYAYLDVVENPKLIRKVDNIEYTNHSAWVSERSTLLREKLVKKAIEEAENELGSSPKQLQMSLY